MTIRQCIIDESARQGVTRAALARDTGISVRHLHAYWANDNDMTGERLDKLMAKIGIEVQCIDRSDDDGEAD